ncbi:uncharacterized protein BJ171DRAFT_42863 [Polychytrium aggregatum]|uniref:uncharacterized protein n=1 Tax=Polychytrium aggregatum TaxID=110093 RepID=UPI0022FEF987|nr:uncharacterized protein BJ171DRAFT_42863 [Polychytrium aggregatum]KAI9206196.1 hypothetical protein BJ171DRAFT_42863 [Polychytrium aggregatum]
MVLLVYGFPNRNSALQFEWAWQYPNRTRHIESRSSSKTLASRLQALESLSTSKRWCRWPLKVLILDPNLKLPRSSAPSRSADTFLPYPISYGHIKELPYDIGDAVAAEFHRQDHLKLVSGADPLPTHRCCKICTCNVSLARLASWVGCIDCKAIFHLGCLAKRFLAQEAGALPCPSESSGRELMPVSGACPGCSRRLEWGSLIEGLRIRIRDKCERSPQGGVADEDSGSESECQISSSEEENTNDRSELASICNDSDPVGSLSSQPSQPSASAMHESSTRRKPGAIIGLDSSNELDHPRDLTAVAPLGSASGSSPRPRRCISKNKMASAQALNGKPTAAARAHAQPATRGSRAANQSALGWKQAKSVLVSISSSDMSANLTCSRKSPGRRLPEKASAPPLGLCDTSDEETIGSQRTTQSQGQLSRSRAQADDPRNAAILVPSDDSD